MIINKYSWLQKKLHNVALSSKFMRETSFDLENIFFSNECNKNNHIFICGLARSGTTSLFNAIHESNKFASLTYADMPFVLAPNFWSKLYYSNKNIKSDERAHGDGINISINSPEAFEEVFWKTFNDSQKDSLLKYQVFVNNVKKKYNKNRYLCKNNHNIKRLNLISDIYPNAKIFILCRDPIQQANSILIQHKKFIKESKKDNFISEYMKLIGHTEFGASYRPIYTVDLQYLNDLNINHWLEQWYLSYKECLKKNVRNDKCYFIPYTSLCNSEITWNFVTRQLDINKSYGFTFKESIKQFDGEIDQNLVYKCNKIYRKIKKIHFNESKMPDNYVKKGL